MAQTSRREFTFLQRVVDFWNRLLGEAASSDLVLVSIEERFNNYWAATFPNVIVSVLQPWMLAISFVQFVFSLLMLALRSDVWHAIFY